MCLTVGLAVPWKQRTSGVPVLGESLLPEKPPIRLDAGIVQNGDSRLVEHLVECPILGNFCLLRAGLENHDVAIS